MVISRQLDDHCEYYFRHDKIQEYFIVQTFLISHLPQKEEETKIDTQKTLVSLEHDRPQKHINDPRFRGVYLLLATLLSLSEAIQLRETLIQNAVETKDHVVSDQFIQRINSRQELASNQDKDQMITELMQIIKIQAGQKITNQNIVTATAENDFMSESYKSKYDQRQSQNSFVDTAQSGSKQKFNQTQHNYPSAEKQTLAEAATEIQNLLKQLEATNPNATDTEKQAYVNLAIPPTTKERFVGAIKAGGKEAITEFLDNPYVNVAVAITEGWQNPDDR